MSEAVERPQHLAGDSRTGRLLPEFLLDPTLGLSTKPRRYRPRRLRYLRLHTACESDALIFNLRPERAGLGGLALRLLLASTPVPETMSMFSSPAPAAPPGGPVRARITLFEEGNPVPLRESTATLEAKGGEQILLFSFAPIDDSQGRPLTAVVQLSPWPLYAQVLTHYEPEEVTVLGGRRYRYTAPLALPYYRADDEAVAGRGLPLVSVLIVTYNAASYLRPCLDSVFDQDYPNLEVVVVDNDSKDATVDIIRREYPQVKLHLAGKNWDFARGNNIGLPFCDGEYLYILNADTAIRRSAVSNLVRHMALSPRIATVSANIRTKASLSRYADVFLTRSGIHGDPERLKSSCFVAAPCGAAFLIRRKVVDELGYLFDEGFVTNWEDHDLGLRCWLAGYACLHIASEDVFHIGGGVYGLINPKRMMKVMRNQLLTYAKNLRPLSFVRTTREVVRTQRSLYGLVGELRFLRDVWDFLPERRRLQGERRLSDEAVFTLAAGWPGVIASQPSEDAAVHTAPAVLPTVDRLGR